MKKEEIETQKLVLNTMKTNLNQINDFLKSDDFVKKDIKMFWLFLVLAGFFGGILGGMGMGGGTLLVPILTLLLGFSQHIAQAVNLIVFIPTAIIAVIIHLKNKLIDFKAFLLLCIPAIFSAVLFAFLSADINKETLKIIFGVFLVCVGVFQFIVAIINNKKKPKKFTEKLGL